MANMNIGAAGLVAGAGAGAAATIDGRERRDQRAKLRALLRESTKDLGIFDPDSTNSADPAQYVRQPIRESRRAYRRGGDAGSATMTLVDVDGLLEWRDGGGVMMPPGRRSGRRGLFGFWGGKGEVVEQYTFEKLPPNRMRQFLVDLDSRFTPNLGLTRLGKDRKPVPVGPRASFTVSKRVLLIVHGTFSTSEHILSELESTKEGAALLDDAIAHYDHVVAFNHPTLSVGAVLNALDLSRWFANADKNTEVDVICHSRGGLVTRWWMEVMGGGAIAKRAVLVGSPLAGTSLAAPAKIRAVANMLTNYGHALQLAGAAGSTCVPLLGFAAGLMKILTSLTSIAGRTPLVDAAVAMIPGLACQSREGTNPEILRLREGTSWPTYYVVTANFEAPDHGWRFWKRFGDWRQWAADRAADCLFEKENDLVVDTDCMDQLSDNDRIQQADDVLAFGPTDGVHHLNYFRQPKTVAFIRRKLQIP